MAETLDRRVTRLEVTVSNLENRLAKGLEVIGQLDDNVTHLLDQQADARDAEDRQYKRIASRIRVLTLVVAVAAVIVPIVVTYLHGH